MACPLGALEASTHHLEEYIADGLALRPVLVPLLQILQQLLIHSQERFHDREDLSTRAHDTHHTHNVSNPRARAVMRACAEGEPE